MTLERICHEKDKPIFVTKNGYGDMVLMSMETYVRNMARAASDLSSIHASLPLLDKSDLSEFIPHGGTIGV